MPGRPGVAIAEPVRAANEETPHHHAWKLMQRLHTAISLFARFLIYGVAGLKNIQKQRRAKLVQAFRFVLLATTGSDFGSHVLNGFWGRPLTERRTLPGLHEDRAAFPTMATTRPT
eukprot:5285695-Amphidinium_carterae.1